MSRIQKILLGLFFILIILYGLYEVNDELNDLKLHKETLWHVALEISVVVASFSGLIYFSFILYSQNVKHKKLEESLKRIRKDLESSNVRLQKGKKEYQNVIQWQFKEWLLSPSEQEIALLMLKGLSIKEIADSRSTHEKTVRKQASAVYEKSKLAGRHELSAWFFEDLL